MSKDCDNCLRKYTDFCNYCISDLRLNELLELKSLNRKQRRALLQHKITSGELIEKYPYLQDLLNCKKGI